LLDPLLSARTRSNTCGRFRPLRFLPPVPQSSPTPTPSAQQRLATSSEGGEGGRHGGWPVVGAVASVVCCRSQGPSGMQSHTHLAPPPHPHPHPQAHSLTSTGTRHHIHDVSGCLGHGWIALPLAWTQAPSLSDRLLSSFSQSTHPPHPRTHTQVSTNTTTTTTASKSRRSSISSSNSSSSSSSSSSSTMPSSTYRGASPERGRGREGGREGGDVRKETSASLVIHKMPQPHSCITTCSFSAF